MLADDPAQGLRLQEAVGHDEVGAGEPADVGQAPGVGVEHRHDGQDAVRLADAERAAGGDAECVKEGRAVAVGDSLRVAGGAARVAHGAGGPLIDLRPVEGGRLAGDHLVVAVDGSSARLERRGVAVADDDEVLDRLEGGRDLPEEWNEGVVDDHHAVLGVVRDVGQLLREQADVQGVKNGAHAGDREVGLQVFLVVPGEGADPVSRLDAEALERVGELGAALRDFGVGADPCAVRLAGDDPAVSVHPASVIEDHPDRQREVHHRAECHRGAPGSGSSWCIGGCRSGTLATRCRPA